MRVLVVTKIFPNAREPTAASFNRQQFAALARRCEVEVLATIPWLPPPLARRSRAGALVDVPRHEIVEGLDVAHPRYVYLPKIGDAVAAPLYAASLLAPVLRRRFDVMLASWAYPDGVAAVMLGALRAVPVVVKLHGSDLDVLGARPAVRPYLRWAFGRARAVVAVSRPLRERAVELGAPSGRARVVPNGVDVDRFALLDRAAARRALGLSPGGKLLVYVGRLTREKGIDDLLQAFGVLARARDDVSLALVGDGEARGRIEAGAPRVHLAGDRPHDEIPRWLAAADVVTLPSWHEGTPNAVLEALACGRRVVATRVGGVPDLIHRPELGALVPPRDPRALAAALGAALDRDEDPARVRALAGTRSWQDSADRLLSVLTEAAS